MRFMMFMIPAVYQGGKDKRVGADFTPPADAVEPMIKYNKELAKAGALIALDGLHPIEKGARVSFSLGKATVTDGPLIESGGGYDRDPSGIRDFRLARGCTEGSREFHGEGSGEKT